MHNKINSVHGSEAINLKSTELHKAFSVHLYSGFQSNRICNHLWFHVDFFCFISFIFFLKNLTNFYAHTLANMTYLKARIHRDNR